MKLATLKNSGRDGALVVVSRLGDRFIEATSVAPTLQAALDDWDRTAPKLLELSADLESKKQAGSALDPAQLAAPLPRAYEWVDGSAYINHIVLVRRARGAAPPETLETDPLVYQGGSGKLLGAMEDYVLPDQSWGLDFESEVALILGDTPRGVSVAEASRYVRLVLLVNDWTYRNLVPPELAKGFGFFASKPATGFSPFAVTPDELGNAFRGGRVYHRLCTRLNGKVVGDPEAGEEMHFSFFDLIAHITRTRAYTAGTILGSGTVSNRDPARGVSCLAELRAREMIELGKPVTPFLKVGDRVEIEMQGEDGTSIFGRIQQRVVEP